MSDEFGRCLVFVLAHEGGWADDAHDPGGATNRGVTLATYTRWRAAHNLPAPTKADLSNITDAEVEEIYRAWYWQASGADRLAWPLCLAHFDLAVNGGVGRAADALAASNGNFLRYMGWRLHWYARLNTWHYYGAAWVRRCADLLAEAAG